TAVLPANSFMYAPPWDYCRMSRCATLGRTDNRPIQIITLRREGWRGNRGGRPRLCGADWRGSSPRHRLVLVVIDQIAGDVSNVICERSDLSGGDPNRVLAFLRTRTVTRSCPAWLP